MQTLDLVPAIDSTKIQTRFKESIVTEATIVKVQSYKNRYTCFDLLKFYFSRICIFEIIVVSYSIYPRLTNLNFTEIPFFSSFF